MSDKIEIAPTVLMNISDHYTRIKVSLNNPKVRCIGGLVGQVEGRKIKLQQTFEFKYTLDGNNQEIVDIDLEFIKQKVDLLKVEMSGNLFKDYEFLGWYSAGSNLTPLPSDLKFQNAINDRFQNNPIYLVSDTVTNMKNKVDLPIKIFEVKYEQVLANEQHKYLTQESYAELAYDVVASKADTITIESTSKSYQSSAQSQFAENLKTTVNAVSRFSEKVAGILKALDNPAVSSNPQLLLELNQILCSFPQQCHDSLDAKMIEHYSDGNIISFLSALAATNRVIQNVSEHKSSFKSSKPMY